MKQRTCCKKFLEKIQVIVNRLSFARAKLKISNQEATIQNHTYPGLHIFITDVPVISSFSNLDQLEIALGIMYWF